MSQRKWTDKEAQFVFDHYKDMRDTDIGNAIGRTRSSVKAFRDRNNLTCGKVFGLTEDQAEYIWATRMKLAPDQVAKKLGVMTWKVREYISDRVAWRERQSYRVSRRIGAMRGDTRVRTAAEIVRGYPLLDRIRILQQRKREIEWCLSLWTLNYRSTTSQHLRAALDRAQEAALLEKYRDVKDELRCVTRQKYVA